MQCHDLTFANTLNNLFPCKWPRYIEASIVLIFFPLLIRAFPISLVHITFPSSHWVRVNCAREGTNRYPGRHTRANCVANMVLNWSQGRPVFFLNYILYTPNEIVWCYCFYLKQSLAFFRNETERISKMWARKREARFSFFFLVKYSFEFGYF